MTEGAGDTHSDLPMAQVRRRAHWSWWWLMPLLAAGLAAWLLFDALAGQGVKVVVELPHGHGLKPGDALRYRGIPVGTVRALRLTDDLTAIRAEVRLEPNARELAREGSHFWVGWLTSLAASKPFWD